MAVFGRRIWRVSLGFAAPTPGVEASGQHKHMLD
jgi:hypothetical protein